MHPDLQRYLDGEIPRSALTPELAREAEEWRELLTDLARLGEPKAPTWLECRVMAALPARPRDAWWRRALRWAIEPHTIRLRPVALLPVAALAALLAWPRSRPTATAAPDDAAAGAVGGTDGGAMVYVQFVLKAPQARSVAVAGDFNAWQPAAAELRDANGDGVWTGFIPLPAGVHKYMFVVDGQRWISDPQAERYVDDGFGMRNALISVTPPVRSS
ncbi:MAG: isoamylase early set domain-containing protein [Gemmatimonadetes bacterium]|nr:isoamylase early set domain-containing protein [Gemmatimonadota bacterium]